MRKTNCDPELLDRYIQGELDDRLCSLVEAHAAECEECAAKIETGLAEVAAALKVASPELTVPMAVHERVYALVHSRHWLRGLWNRIPSPLTAATQGGFSRREFWRMVAGAGTAIGLMSVPAAYAYASYRRLQTEVAVLTLRFPPDAFIAGDANNQVNVVVMVAGSEVPIALRATLPEHGNEVHLPAIAGGHLVIAVEKQPGTNKPPISFYWEGKATGEQTVDVHRVDPGSREYDTVVALLSGVSSVPKEINQSRLLVERRAFVAYRDIEVSVDGQVVFREDFASVSDQGQPTSLIRKWAGYAARVTQGLGDGPAFILEFLPNSNEAWWKPLPGGDSARTVQFGITLMAPDPARGGQFGLFRANGILNTESVCQVTLAGDLTLEGRRLLSNALPFHWYRVEVTYHALQKRADVTVDGTAVADVPVPGGRFDGFLISGVNFAGEG